MMDTTEHPQTANGVGILSQYASMYQAVGFHPIPIPANRKAPIIAEWQRLDVDRSAMIKNHNGNLGITFDADTFALDLDRKNGYDGVATIEALGELPQTLTARTPSGGEHRIFRKPAGLSLKNSVNVLPGVDIRATGAQIVVEPSTIDGKGYSWLDWDPLTGEVPEIAEAPAWLLSLISKQEPENAGQSHAGKTTEGGRNTRLTSLGGSLRHKGLSENAIHAALVGINQMECDPPLPAHELETIARSVAQYKPACDRASPDAESEPEPLRAPLPRAELYPVTALGEVLGGAAKAINESVKAPLALCCQSVLAAASLAVQTHFDIKLPWGERKPLSLFLLTVGVSGERKSGVDDLVLGAAKVQERAEMEAYASEQRNYEMALASWTHAAEAARKSVTTSKKGTATSEDVRVAVERLGEKPTAPIAPLRFVSDPTVEGLYKLLAISKPSVALFSDEGGLLIGGHALNNDNALKTMARWCKLWDGSPFDRVRAGDGAGILYGRRMALHQLAQPDVMVMLLSDRMANGQGLLARCLVAWPESTIGTRQVEQFKWAGGRPELKRLFAVLKELMEAPPSCGRTEQELNPVELPLTDEAKALAVAASNQFEALMGKGADLAELTDRTSKALEQACRLAGVLAVIEGGMSVRAIERPYLERGLILMQWYLAEALRIRGAAAIPQSVTDAETLMAWLMAQSLGVFRSRQVLTRGPSQLRNKARLMSAIAELIQNGYLVENEPGEIVEGVKTRKSWRVLHYVV